MTDPDPLSYERISQARETLTAAFAEFMRGTPPARGGDAAMAMSEAKRNLTALVQTRYGQEAFERMLDED